MYAYFASKQIFRNMYKLKPGSELSFWPHIVINTNLYHLDTGKKWNTEDLSKDYLLTPTIGFKYGKEPEGTPNLYRVILKESEIAYGNNFPYLFRNKYPLLLRKVSDEDRNMLMNLSISIYHNFCLVRPGKN